MALLHTKQAYGRQGSFCDLIYAVHAPVKLETCLEVSPLVICSQNRSSGNAAKELLSKAQAYEQQLDVRNAIKAYEVFLQFSSSSVSTELFAKDLECFHIQIIQSVIGGGAS